MKGYKNRRHNEIVSEKINRLENLINDKYSLIFNLQRQNSVNINQIDSLRTEVLSKNQSSRESKKKFLKEKRLNEIFDKEKTENFKFNIDYKKRVSAENGFLFKRKKNINENFIQKYEELYTLSYNNNNIGNTKENNKKSSKEKINNLINKIRDLNKINLKNQRKNGSININNITNFDYDLDDFNLNLYFGRISKNKNISNNINNKMVKIKNRIKSFSNNNYSGHKKTNQFNKKNNFYNDFPFTTPQMRNSNKSVITNLFTYINNNDFTFSDDSLRQKIKKSNSKSSFGKTNNFITKKNCLYYHEDFPKSTLTSNLNNHSYRMKNKNSLNLTQYLINVKNGNFHSIQQDIPSTLNFSIINKNNNFSSSKLFPIQKLPENINFKEIRTPFKLMFDKINYYSNSNKNNERDKKYNNSQYKNSYSLDKYKNNKNNTRPLSSDNGLIRNKKNNSKILFGEKKNRNNNKYNFNDISYEDFNYKHIHNDELESKINLFKAKLNLLSVK